MKTHAIALTVLAIFVILIILDYIWLGILTKKFIISEFGPLVSVKNGGLQINLAAGILTWLIIALGVFIFAVYPSSTIGKAALMGAVFGFISYSIYDLTNLTFIKDYPVKFVFVDIAWGTFLCAAISTVGYYIKSLF